jgi:hypothetical protein
LTKGGALDNGGAEAGWESFESSLDVEFGTGVSRAVFKI